MKQKKEKKPVFFMHGERVGSRIAGYSLSMLKRERLWYERKSSLSLYNGGSEAKNIIVYDIFFDNNEELYARIEVIEDSMEYFLIENMEPTVNSPFTYEFK